MCILRVIRGCSALVKRYPIVDRVAAYKKGGNLRNVFLSSCSPELHPLFALTPWTTSWGSNMTPHKIAATHQLTIQTLSFSTSTPLFSSAYSSSDLKKAIDHLTDQFMETRELLEDARESTGTVYFSEDMEEASESVKKTLQEYQELLSKLSDEQRQEVLRTIGLKMEELKAQQQALEDQ